MSGSRSNAGLIQGKSLVPNVFDSKIVSVPIFCYSPLVHSRSSVMTYSNDVLVPPTSGLKIAQIHDKKLVVDAKPDAAIMTDEDLHLLQWELRICEKEIELDRRRLELDRQLIQQDSGVFACAHVQIDHAMMQSKALAFRERSLTIRALKLDKRKLDFDKLFRHKSKIAKENARAVPIVKESTRMMDDGNEVESASIVDPLDSELAGKCARQVLKDVACCSEIVNANRVTAEIVPLRVQFEEKHCLDSDCGSNVSDHRMLGERRREPSTSLGLTSRDSIAIADNDGLNNAVSLSTNNKVHIRIMKCRTFSLKYKTHGMQIPSHRHTSDKGMIARTNKKHASPGIQVVSGNYKTFALTNGQTKSTEGRHVQTIDPNQLDRVVLDVQSRVRPMCLGPATKSSIEVQSKSDLSCAGIRGRNKYLDSTIWIAVCTGDNSLLIYDWKKRKRLFTFRQFEVYGTSHIITIFPFIYNPGFVSLKINICREKYARYISWRRLSSRAHNG